MATYDKIEKIKEVNEKLKAGQELVPEAPMDRASPNKERFDSLVNAPAEPMEPVEKARRSNQDSRDSRKIDTSKTSLMDEVRNLDKQVANAGKASPEALVAQTQDVIAKIEEIKDKLNSPNLELKSSVQNLLKNKLSHIDENLRITLSKAGVEYSSVVPGATAAPANPIERFLGFLTDGQHRLKMLGSEVESWHLNKTDINPATMLAMQVKVGFMTQELEFFSALLNKALESTKTIMNVQV